MRAGVFRNLIRYIEKGEIKGFVTMKTFIDWHKKYVE